jgi:hypothetical protein
LENLKNNINLLRDDLQNNVKTQLNSIIGRELMMEKIFVSIIPNLAQLYDSSLLKLKEFKTSLYQRPAFFISVGLTLSTVIGSYLYYTNALASFKGILGYFFLSFRFTNKC